MRIPKFIILSTCFALSASAYAWSADGTFLPPQPGANKTGVVTSIEAMESTPYVTANQFSLAADYQIQNKHYDEAIRLCKKALTFDHTDLEIHKTYAQALEGKMKSEKSSDPDLFNTCLREWLIVMRMECGPDKLPNFHGIMVPGYASLYGDEDYNIEALYHLQGLTGKKPKPWETDAAYIKRAGQQTESTVSGKLLKKEEEPRAIKPQVLTPGTYKAPDPLDWLNNGP